MKHPPHRVDARKRYNTEHVPKLSI